MSLELSPLQLAYVALISSGLISVFRLLYIAAKKQNWTLPRGLTEGISAEKLRSDTWAGEVLALPVGELDVRFDPRELEWAGWRLGDFLPAAYLEVRGLRNRYRRSGVGAPLVASLAAPVSGRSAEQQRAHIPPRLKVPVTAFLRIEAARERLTSGALQARLELFAEDETRQVEVDGRMEERP